MSQNESRRRVTALSLLSIATIAFLATTVCLSIFLYLVIDSHSSTGREWQNEIDRLRALRLHAINFEWYFNESSMNNNSVLFRGIVFNSGDYVALNVKIHVLLLGFNNTLINDSIVNVGYINPRTYVNFYRVIEYVGHCENLSYDILDSNMQPGP